MAEDGTDSEAWSEAGSQAVPNRGFVAQKTTTYKAKNIANAGAQGHYVSLTWHIVTPHDPWLI